MMTDYDFELARKDFMIYTHDNKFNPVH
jgi:hypothetical protein